MDTLLWPLKVAVAWVMVTIHKALILVGFPGRAGIAWVLSIIGLTNRGAAAHHAALRQADPRVSWNAAPSAGECKRFRPSTRARRILSRASA